MGPLKRLDFYCLEVAQLLPTALKALDGFHLILESEYGALAKASDGIKYEGIKICKKKLY